MRSVTSLPTELSEQVLLQADPNTLVSLCGTSLQYRSICSGPFFWRIRFEQEGLPLLEQGDNAQEWIRIYQKSHRVAQLAEDYLEEGSKIIFGQINLDELSKIAPGLVKTYIRQEKERQELLQERKLLEEENADKDVIDDLEVALQIIPEYSLVMRNEGNTYALDNLLYVPLERDYEYMVIQRGLTPKQAFELLFTLLY